MIAALVHAQATIIVLCIVIGVLVQELRHQRNRAIAAEAQLERIISGESTRPHWLYDR